MAIEEEMTVNGNTSRTATKGRTVNDDLNGTFTVYSADKIPQIMIGPDPDTGYPSITLYDTGGVALISLAITSATTPQLAFKNTSGNTMMTIGLTGSNSAPLIEMDNANGVKQITMGVDSTAGQSNVSVYSSDGTRQTYMGIDPAQATPVIAVTELGTDVVTKLRE